MGKVSTIRVRKLILLSDSVYSKCRRALNFKTRKKDGYIIIERQGKNVYFHRWLYEQKYGKVGFGVVIRHICNHPWCLNIKHLKAGTQKDNIQDQIKIGTFVKGEKNGLAKLTDLQVKKLRKEINLTFAELAKKYGISSSVAWQVYNKITWKHVI